MKNILPLLLLLTIVSGSFTSNAQVSCSFMIHVDGANGTDNGTCGTEGSPCASINQGIDRAIDEGYSDVRISSNTNYLEVIEMVDGISLWGGFDAQWAATGLTTITGGLAGNGEFYAIRADAINTSTVLSDLEIIAPDALTAGKSSYGVHITNSTGLLVQRVTVQGGLGADGTPGANGTNSSTTGANGGNGGDSDEFTTSCNDDDSGDGGGGAITSGIANTAGGNGGRGGYMDDDCSGFPDLDATGGIAGNNATVFAISSHGYRGGGGGTCSGGADGNDGQTVHGAGGAGATSAANVIGMFWEALPGEAGSPGEHGTGGGGGGGSGGCDSGTDSYGAGGGGGGGGGLAATSNGTGGLSGGNSAAVFMLTSTASFIDCSFFLGTGGNGAAGGNGALGAAGGNGGNGGAGVGTGAGGDGGDGGAGGNSGAGGGGAGGSAYGIFGSNSTVNRIGSSFSGGSNSTGGDGGTGTPAGLEGSVGAGGIPLNMAGTITDNVGPLTAESDPCIEIITTDLAILEFCAGESTTVSYNAVGSFSGLNTFTAQLSDGSGDFTTPTDIGSIVSNTSGAVTVTIPANTLSGTGYRIRVVSSATPAIGIENVTDIVINALPTVVANATSMNVCIGDEVTLSGSGADLYTWNNGVTDGAAFVPQETLYYTVIGVDAVTVCANIDSVQISVVDLPDTSVVQNGNQLAAVLSGATYQWIDCGNNNAEINGATEQTYAAPSTGDYAVVVTANACSDTSSCYNVTVVGLEERINDPVLIVYPNPSEGNFQLISDSNLPMSLDVFDTAGKLVASESNVLSNSAINLSGLRNGIYYLRFVNDDSSLTRQVIIQK